MASEPARKALDAIVLETQRANTARTDPHRMRIHLAVMRAQIAKLEAMYRD